MILIRRIANFFRQQPAGAEPGAGPPPDTELRPNTMLQRIIAGRTIRALAVNAAPASITFTDGSVMRVKTGAPLQAGTLIGKTIKSVRQGGLRLELQFEDGSTAQITLAEETSSVLLRDAKGTFEYAD